MATHQMSDRILAQIVASGSAGVSRLSVSQGFAPEPFTRSRSTDNDLVEHFDAEPVQRKVHHCEDEAAVVEAVGPLGIDAVQGRGERPLCAPGADCRSPRRGFRQSVQRPPHRRQSSDHILTGQGVGPTSPSRLTLLARERSVSAQAAEVRFRCRTDVIASPCSLGGATSIPVVTEIELSGFYSSLCSRTKAQA